MSPSYLRHLFREQTGKTLTEYITELRISEAKKLLRSTDDSILSIALAVGFNDQSYFSKVFQKSVGTSPSRYRASISG